MSNIRNFYIDDSPENTSLLQKYLPNFSVKAFTFRISALQAIFYVLSVMLGQDGIDPSICSLLFLGAKYSPFIVLKYQVWRLVTPIVLHGSISHFLFNMIFQLRFGFAIENYYGMKRFIAIYVIAGFGGNLISAAMSAETVAIGASTSGYGMLAVLGCFYAYKWHTFGVGRNFNLAIYLGFVAFGIINTLANVGIDKYGHLGGFLFGGLIGFVLIKRDENSKIWNIVIFSSVILISILFIVFVVILATLDFNCEQDYGNSDCAICEGLNPKKYN